MFSTQTTVIVGLGQFLRMFTNPRRWQTIRLVYAYYNTRHLCNNNININTTRDRIRGTTFPLDSGPAVTNITQRKGN